MKLVILKKSNINFSKKADRLKDIIFKKSLKLVIKAKVSIFVILYSPL